MIIVGFILLAAAAVVAVALVIQNPSTVTVHAFKWSWDVDGRWLVVAGLALTAIGLFGLWMMRIGGSHYLRLRAERRRLAAENKRLAERVGAQDRPTRYEQRAPMPAAPAPVPAPAPRMDTRPAAPPMAPTGSNTAPASGSVIAPATGSVAAPERPFDHPHGIRERLVASRHRRAKG
jgi:uncharacterized integral membrane protein